MYLEVRPGIRDPYRKVRCMFMLQRRGGSGTSAVLGLASTTQPRQNLPCFSPFCPCPCRIIARDSDSVRRWSALPCHALHFHARSV